MNERSCRMNDIEKWFGVVFLRWDRHYFVAAAVGAYPRTHKGHPKVAFAWCSSQLSARLI